MLNTDNRLEKIAKSLARASILQSLSFQGILSINPDYVTRRIEESWPDFLFYAEDVIQTVSDAVSVKAHPEINSCLEILEDLKKQAKTAKEEYEKMLPIDM